MIRLFSQPWAEVSVCFVDTETTGVKVGIDKAVSVALVRFEHGKEVGSFSSLVNPGMPIPEAATEIHKLIDSDVEDAPTIAEVFALPEVKALIEGAAPGAYVADFDRGMIPEICDRSWPFIDPIVLVRHVDRYVKGPGRHKLDAACARHGIKLENAHNALADARACGALWYALGVDKFPKDATLGRVLWWQMKEAAAEWYRFTEYVAGLPPKEEEGLI